MTGSMRNHPTLPRRVYHLRDLAGRTRAAGIQEGSERQSDSLPPFDPPSSTLITQRKRSGPTQSNQRRGLPSAIIDHSAPSAPFQASSSAAHQVFGSDPSRSRRTARRLGSRTTITTAGLLKLPAELLLYISDIILADPRDPEESGLMSQDFFNFSSSCRHIRQVTCCLLTRQLVIRIDDRPGSFAQAVERLGTICGQSWITRNPARLRKLWIIDDGPDLGARGAGRRSWQKAIAKYLESPQLEYLESFGYSRILSKVTQQSPYELTTIDPSLLIGITRLPRLKTLYMSGIELSRGRRGWEGKMPESLSTVHLIAVDDTVLETIRRCPGLTHLRIWRNFLVRYQHFEHWFDTEQWIRLRSLSLKGFNGKQLRQLQQSLKHSRKLATEKGLEVKLHTIDLDEPYTPRDVVSLLESFSSSCVRVFKVQFWYDRQYNPELFEKLAKLVPRLSRLEVVLGARDLKWWPCQLSEWAKELSRMNELEELSWNCGPFTTNDPETTMSAIRLQGKVLARWIPKLRKISFFGIDGNVSINRWGPDNKIKSVKWITGSGIKLKEIVIQTEEDRENLRSDPLTRSSQSDPFSNSGSCTHTDIDKFIKSCRKNRTLRRSTMNNFNMMKIV